MRGCCCWFVLFFASSAVGLPLATGDWRSGFWAFLIAPVLTWAAHFGVEDLRARRRFRRYFALADRIGARDGQVIRESTKRYTVFSFDPGVNVQTLRRGTKAEVRETLRAAAAAAGYGIVPHGSHSLTSEAYKVAIGIRVYEPGEGQHNVPEGFVKAEVSIDDWNGFRPRKPRRARGGTRPA